MEQEITVTLSKAQVLAALRRYLRDEVVQSQVQIVDMSIIVFGNVLTGYKDDDLKFEVVARLSDRENFGM